MATLSEQARPIATAEETAREWWRKGFDMELNKLTADDLSAIAGGTADDAYALALEMCKQYGVPEGDFDALFAVISDDDHRRLFDELSKRG